jgi:SAM-dependent methyltransferase
MTSREEILLGHVPKSSKIVEIGPSYCPLAPKSQGWNSFSIDHDDRHGLIKKYAADPSVNVDLIEEVDFVWSSGPLVDTVPTGHRGTFDVFIASHVIEHAPDIVAFLESASQLIKPDGVIILAIPDKRKCFDFYRPLSTTGDAILSSMEKRSRHDAKTHFDHGMYMATKGGSAGWPMEDLRPLVLNTPVSHGLGYIGRASQDHYIDAHHWIFVPSSFRLMIDELAHFKLLNLRIENVQEAAATEFYAWLRVGAENISAEDLQARRRPLLDRIMIEVAEQTRQIPGSPLSLAAKQITQLEAALAVLNRTRGL